MNNIFDVQDENVGSKTMEPDAVESEDLDLGMLIPAGI